MLTKNNPLAPSFARPRFLVPMDYLTPESYIKSNIVMHYLDLMMIRALMNLFHISHSCMITSQSAQAKKRVWLVTQSNYMYFYSMRHSLHWVWSPSIWLHILTCVDWRPDIGLDGSDCLRSLLFLIFTRFSFIWLDNSNSCRLLLLMLGCAILRYITSVSSSSMLACGVNTKWPLI